jgi:GTP-binding protein
MLIHVIDISSIDGRNPYQDYLAINKELNKFSAKLSTLPQIIALNKCDLLVTKEAIDEFKSHFDKDTKIVEISALGRTNVQDLIKETYAMLCTLPEREPIPVEEYNFDAKDVTSINVTVDERGVYEVTGGYIDNLIRSVVLSDYESNAFFQRRLKEDGILDKLREKGAKEGDTVRIGNIEFEFID